MNKTTVHVIGCPGNPSRKFPTIDPFARVSYTLTNSLTDLGWNINYYGYEESTVKCTNKFGVVNLDWKTKFIENPNDNTPRVATPTGDCEIAFADEAFKSLKINSKPGDIAIFMWSTIPYYMNNLGLQDLGLYVIDGHIGHYDPSTVCSYHVYASSSLQSWLYAKDDKRFANRYHDIVIPPIAHSTDDYTYSEEKEDYFLFMSRLIENKGLGIVIDMAKELPTYKFKIAGEGDWAYWSQRAPKNVEYIGYLDGDARADALSKAKAVITPALYFEPFGLTAVESAISGTPIISTDWGGYTNNVIHGVTGFRCTILRDFIDAVLNIDQIDPKDCRAWGKLHSSEELIKRWKDYLIRVKRGGWYNIDDSDSIEESLISKNN